MNQRELMIGGAKELGLSLSSEQVDALLLYKDELGKWNRKINLTAITGDRDVLIKHFLDSLSYLKGFDPVPGLRLLDMGSGAGFPAIPVKIACPQISIALVESVKKKASFLRHIQRTLGLSGVDVLDMRTGEVNEAYENTYDVVTARAFAEMRAALAAGARFLMVSGLMVLSRGSGENLEEQEIETAGFVLEKKVDFKLPYSDYDRALWVFKKVEEV